MINTHSELLTNITSMMLEFSLFVPDSTLLRYCEIWKKHEILNYTVKSSTHADLLTNITMILEFSMFIPDSTLLRYCEIWEKHEILARVQNMLICSQIKYYYDAGIFHVHQDKLYLVNIHFFTVTTFESCNHLVINFKNVQLIITTQE